MWGQRSGCKKHSVAFGIAGEGRYSGVWVMQDRYGRSFIVDLLGAWIPNRASVTAIFVNTAT